MLRQKVVVNGKRVGQSGFVCSRKELADALKSAPAFGVKIGNITVGRNGFAKFLQYMRGATQTVKVTPKDDILSIQFGSNCAVDIPNRKWIPSKKQTDAEWFDFVQVEVGKRAKYTPNVSAKELAKAINKALLTAPKEEYDSLSKIAFISQKEALKICSTDRFKLTVYELCSDVEIQGTLETNDAKIIAKALAKSERARIEVYTKEHSIYSSEGPTTAQTKYVAIYADQQKFETQLETYIPTAILINSRCQRISEYH